MTAAGQQGSVRRAVVRDTGHYLPDRVVDNDFFAQTLDTSDEWIRSRTGIERRHFAADDQRTSDLAIAAARAGATTGEWAATLRDVFGSYRAPTGVGEAAAPAPGEEIAALRDDVAALSEQLGRNLKILVGKPGLDGHSNGAEQIAVRARDAGMEVVYEGIRLTPARIANAALEEGVHIVGLSILSGSHMPLVKEVLRKMRELGIGEIPVVVGGIIPPEDAKELLAAGVARVYTPKDYEIQDVISDLVGIAAAGYERAA